MSARLARHVTSTALAAAVLLIFAPGAIAAPPTCVAPEPETTVENVAWPFFLYGYCQDSDTDPLLLTFAIVDQPDHGTLHADNGDVVYTPNADYVGPDSFSFTAADETDVTDPVVVAISVAENQAPSCPATIPLEVEPDVPTSFYPFDCTDDAAILDFTLADPPMHGTVAPFDEFEGFLYEPDPGYSGPDSFTFHATDGELTSGLATVEITVLPPNHAPHCVTPIYLRVAVNGALRLDNLNVCRDPDGDAFFPGLDAGPAHGRLDVNLPEITYRPNPGYSGPDQIRYYVTDERGAQSNIAVLNITVGNPIVTPSRDVLAPTLDLARAGKQKLKAVRKQGLKLELTCDEGGTMTIVVSVSKATARKLKIKPKAKGRVVIGRVTKAVSAGENKITVKLSRKARKRLASVAKIKLLVAVRVVDAAGNTGKDTLQITLKR
jgi:hypothetical protein